MDTEVYTRQADNLLELITLIAEAIGELGAYAGWCGYEDGALHMWLGNDGPIFVVEPMAKIISRELETGEES